MCKAGRPWGSTKAASAAADGLLVVAGHHKVPLQLPMQEASKNSVPVRARAQGQGQAKFMACGTLDIS